MKNIIKPSEKKENTEPVNLGLDADRSSESPSVNNRLNDDNDRITGNPNGENDEKADDEYSITTPIDDK